MNSLPSKTPIRKKDVDFEDEDGFLHRGKIICGTENGILVEPQTGKYAGSTQLVPYGKVYFSEKTFRPELIWEMIKHGGQMVVDVLARPSVDLPFQWHPATLVQFDRASTFGLASIVQENSTVKVIVPANLIRTRSTKWVAVKQEDCRELAEGSLKVATIERVDGADANGLPAEHLPSDPDVSDGSGIHLLPVVILAEVFQCFETLVRCRYRRVCSHWNSVLTMPCIQNQLRLHYSGRVKSEGMVNDGRPEEAYLNAVCASKCWAPIVIITGSTDLLRFSASFFCRIMQGFGHPPPRRLILSNLHLDVGTSCDRDLKIALLGIQAEINATASAGGALTLRDVRYDLVVADGFGGTKMAFFKVKVVNGRLVNDQQLSREDWWKMVVEGAPVLTDTQLNCVLDMLGTTHRDANGIVNWENLRQELSEMVGASSESQTGIQMDNPSAKDLAKFQLKQLPKSMQQLYLLVSRQPAVFEAKISW